MTDSFEEYAKKSKRLEDYDGILFWIEETEMLMHHDDFQRDFFESLSDQFYEKEWLSDSQIQSLKRIYERVTS